MVVLHRVPKTITHSLTRAAKWRCCARSVEFVDEDIKMLRIQFEVRSVAAPPCWL